MQEEFIPEISEIKAKHDIRHSLAIDRTKLANERTFLAYTRTSLTMLVPGITFIHFFANSIGLLLLGVFFIPAGLITFLYGLRSFYKKKAVIRKDNQRLNEMLLGQYCNI